jgi:hypothetical protein
MGLGELLNFTDGSGYVLLTNLTIVLSDVYCCLFVIECFKVSISVFCFVSMDVRFSILLIWN